MIILMSNEELENISKNINKTEDTKKLCVHDLKRKLKEKNKKETINKVTILLALIFFIIFLLLIIY